MTDSFPPYSFIVPSSLFTFRSVSWCFQRINHSDSKVAFLTGSRVFRSHQILVWSIFYSHEYYTVITFLSFVVHPLNPNTIFSASLSNQLSLLPPWASQDHQQTVVPHSSLPFPDHLWIFWPAQSAGLLPKLPLLALVHGRVTHPYPWFPIL